MWLGLGASIASLAINAGTESLWGMWLAIVPPALLDQSFGVSKALSADYVEELGGSEAEGAGTVGKLGMAAGCGIMAGPLLATALTSSYRQALLLSALALVASGLLLLALPEPGRRTQASPSRGALTDLLRLPVLQNRGAQLLLCMRLLMGLAFHMFLPVWQVSLKRRFDFGPADHARLMGLIGLCYALSQGFFAKSMMQLSGSDPTGLLLLCVLLLGGGRPIALWTSSVTIVYLLYAPMAIALGVMNTVITASCSRLANGSQLGGLFGVLESVESVSGIVGPAMGGLLARCHADAPLAAVCGCYCIAFAMIFLHFGKHIVQSDKGPADSMSGTSESKKGS
uniref:Major facilitator superfamily (MFS) profile domain-containing protein n=1 Tax=Pyrodinium bahamense TaxID=73915 RepID=A0A7S0A4N7_9DINO